MCEICTSGASHTQISSDYAIRNEKKEPTRGHVLRCVECKWFCFQDEFVNETDCPACGHQILGPVVLASNPDLRDFRGDFVNVAFYDEIFNAYQPPNSNQLISLDPSQILIEHIGLPGNE